MIEVQDLEKRYNDHVAVKGVGFSIQPGEIVGLLGPNGAGKTTIMKILTCYHYPSAGSVKIKDLDIYTDVLEIKKLLGYLPENAPVYPELNVKEYLHFIADTRLGKGGMTASGLNALQAIEKAVADCSLEKVWLKGIDTLSKGYRQRVGLAQAILHEPEILILDEPTTGLDPNQILDIRKLITELGKQKTIILSTHIMQEVEAVCSRVLILNQGSIVAQGRTSEIAAELRGDLTIRIVIKGDATKFGKELAAKASWAKVAVPGQSKASSKSIGLEISAGRNKAEDLESFEELIFDSAVASGAKILELSPQSTSLEDVFISLTADTPAKPEAANE